MHLVELALLMFISLLLPHGHEHVLTLPSLLKGENDAPALVVSI
jgi:hypothetical protein